MNVRNTIFFLPAGIPFAAKSQHKTEHTTMLWEEYYNTFSINKNWSLLSDAQLRTRDWTQHWSQMLVLSGLSYKVNNSSFFDQNRTFAGINIKLQANTALQFQYVKIFQWHSNSSEMDNQNVVRANFIHQFKYSEKDKQNNLW